jgi:hypothetical protein
LGHIFNPWGSLIQKAKSLNLVLVVSCNVFRSSLDRDAKLGSLEERADALQDGCAQVPVLPKVFFFYLRNIFLANALISLFQYKAYHVNYAQDYWYVSGFEPGASVPGGDVMSTAPHRHGILTNVRNICYYKCF